MRKREWKETGRTVLPALVAALLLSAALSAPASAQQVVVRGSLQPDPEPSGIRVEDGEILLTLDEAIEIALRRNLGLVVQRYDRAQVAQAIPLTKGIFDLFSVVDLTTIDSTVPTASELQSGADIFQFEQQDFNVTLNQLTPGGGTAQLAWINQRLESNSLFATLNPSYDSTTRLGFQQPLLRDLGALATKRNILIARNDSDISGELFEQRLIATILQVEQAYWSLVGAQAELEVAEESLNLATELHERNKVQVEVGTMAPLELVQSEAGIASRQLEIIRAKTLIGNAEDQLRRLLNLETGHLWQRPIVPETEPLTTDIEVDLEEAIQTALDERPEYRAQQLQVENLEVESRYFRNQKLPRLDLTVSYALAGTGGDAIQARDPVTGEPTEITPGDFGDAINQITDADFDTWTAALSFAFPIQNRSARAQSAIADLDLEQGRAELRDLEQQIVTQVRLAVRELQSAAQQIEAARANRRAQERNVEAEQKRYENGMSTSFEVLRIQEDLTDARRQEVVAVTLYRSRLAEFYRAIGRLMEERSVALMDDY